MSEEELDTSSGNLGETTLVESSATTDLLKKVEELQNSLIASEKKRQSLETALLEQTRNNNINNTVNANGATSAKNLNNCQESVSSASVMSADAIMNAPLDNTVRLGVIHADANDQPQSVIPANAITNATVNRTISQSVIHADANDQPQSVIPANAITNATVNRTISQSVIHADANQSQQSVIHADANQSQQSVIHADVNARHQSVRYAEANASRPQYSLGQNCTVTNSACYSNPSNAYTSQGYYVFPPSHFDINTNAYGKATQSTTSYNAATSSANNNANTVMFTSHANTINSEYQLAAPLMQNRPQYCETFMPQQPYYSMGARKLIDLPEFKGLPETWPMFEVAYKETSNSYRYSNLENLMRLQKALKGEARQMVESSLIHPSGVENVISTLKFHYGRPEILVKSQITKAKAFPAIMSAKMSEIVQFSTMVVNLTSFLENAAATPYLYNPSLLDELVSKLPPTKREEWHRHVSYIKQPYPSLREFSNWLMDVARFVALATEVVPTKQNQVTHKLNPSKAVYAVAQEKRKCHACEGDHELYNCVKFKEATIEQRWSIVKTHRLCFCCLHNGHNLQNCRRRRQCGVNSCRRSHNRLLHKEEPTSVKCDLSMEPALAVSTCQKTRTADQYENSRNSKTLLKFVPVKVYGPKGSLEIMAFIDEGAEVTLLEEDVAQTIGLKGPENELALKWIDNQTITERSRKLNAEISAACDDAERFQIKNIRTTKKLYLPAQTLDFNVLAKNFANLKHIPVQNYANAVPKLLIGVPHTNLIRAIKIINFDTGFAAHQTKLGWTVYGSNEQSSSCSLVGHVRCEDVVGQLTKQIEDFFSAESFEPKQLPVVISQADKRAQKILRITTKKVGNKYETGLLWASDNIKFPDNYSMALRRLQIVEDKMSREAEFAKWYVDKINEYVQKGYAKKLSPTEAVVHDERTWYLPHFAVCNVNKNNKHRLVFDAAAKHQGVSLNSQLMKGPDEYQPKLLLSVLFKFRQGQFAVIGDIREMFHRVNIRKEDRNAQRFLWRDGNNLKPPEIYIMKAMIFGSACSPCSAQYIKNLNAEVFKETFPRAVTSIVDRHYVDDYVDSFASEEEGIEVTNTVINIHSCAGFELRGILSNSQKLVNQVGEKHASLVESKVLGHEEINQKILGMYWCATNDNLCFKLAFSKVPKDVLCNGRPPTKAEVLSVVMSVFDPIGFLANVTLAPKVLMQQLWHSNIDWRQSIPADMTSKWFEWCAHLAKISDFRAPRCYSAHFLSKEADVQLHIFVDASELAFSAVAYWRIHHLEKVNVTFVAGKSRCSPLRSLSIPRLELQAAVLGVRLKDVVLLNHDVQPSRIVFWTDSKTVLHWISSDARRYKQFVSHRISEILHASKMQQWRWVPGALNPGDEATRPQVFSSTSKWLNGPTFLQYNETEWPCTCDNVAVGEVPEEKKQKHLFTTQEIISILPYNKYSKLNTFLKVMSQIRYAIQKFKSPLRRPNLDQCQISTKINAVVLRSTEMWVIRFVQKEAFPQELICLENKQPIKPQSKINTLTPVLDDDGIMRLGGRIENAECVSFNVKRPIILPKTHLFSKLVVRHFHEILHHQNNEAIICAIRQRYWIPSVRRVLQKVKTECQICKNFAAVPKPPLMGQLPIDRLTPFVRAFTYTGVDFFGPLMVAIGRRREKRWVALYTCLTTRAIHLELARDLSTDAFILTLRNFVNRRGVPVRLRSDRGTNFVGASKEEWVQLEKAIGQECASKNIEWVFNTPADPSAGGVWERMVRSVKRVLLYTLKDKAPQIELLQSLLIEAENCINSRPLTHITIDSKDAEPLTPNHFLLGCPNTVQTPKLDQDVCLKKQWHILQQLKQTFWKRWVLEYLPDLTRRSKWYQPVKPIEVGDVVIICDDNEARSEWKKGLVIEIFPAPDGQVRSALVKTSTTTLRRPASKLAVLDVK